MIVSKSCEGERCWCGAPAAKKVGEEIPFDDPAPARHNLTAYVCGAHYAQMMGPHGVAQVGAEAAHSCPACPVGPRDLGAVLHNLVGQLERGGAILDERSARKLADAKASLARWKPIVDAHFAAVRP